MFAHLNPHSSDFGDFCALYAPFLHQLTMQSSLFERGCPVLVVACVARKLRPCPSYSRRRDRINLGLWRSFYKGGAGYQPTLPARALHFGRELLTTPNLWWLAFRERRLAATLRPQVSEGPRSLVCNYQEHSASADCPVKPRASARHLDRGQADPLPHSCASSSSSSMVPPTSVVLFMVLWEAVAYGVRDELSFDFGWRHRTGLHDWAKPDDRPPVRPDPGPSPPEAQAQYDDSRWAGVQLPHDGLIAGPPSKAACPTGCSGRSYIPRHVLWYRKAFALPADWAGSAIWLDFAGSFRETTVWVNGALVATHACGYTPFRVRLDNVTAVRIGGPNSIAVFVDPDNGDEGARDHGSGWWYEGGGLYRHVTLVRASPVHVEQDGLFAHSDLTWGPDGSATSAAVHARVSLTNTANRSSAVCATVSVAAPSGALVATSRPLPLSVGAGGSATANATLTVASPELWSANRPALYTVTATVHEGSQCSGTARVLDAVDAPHGFRSIRYASF